MTNYATLLTNEYSAHGLPLHYYRQEATRAAILVYVRHMAQPRFEPAPTADELRLVVEYCEYFIHAPCWVMHKREVGMLRASVVAIATIVELETWLYGCRLIGLRPIPSGIAPL